MGMFLRRGTAPHRRSLADVAEGTLVKLNEAGAPVEFYVACHNYEADLNGSGRTLLVRKDCYDERVFSNSNNAYATGSLDEFLNGTYLSLLDANIRTAIGTTKFYYTPGAGDKSLSTLSRAVFQLSVAELGKTASYANTEGSALPIAVTLQNALLNGTAINQWTRSPYFNRTDYVYYMKPGGAVTYYNYNTSRGSRPAFTLPYTIHIGDDMLIA